MKYLCIMMIFASAIAEGADYTAQMRQIVQLRTEIETLNRDVGSLAKEEQSDLDVLVQKRGELRAALLKENLRQTQLVEKTKILAEKVQANGKIHPGDRIQLEQWIQQAEDWVRESLPVGQSNRLQILALLKNRVARGLESYETLTADLWLFWEDEIKAAQQTEFKVSEISFEGTQHKAEVVRLGHFTFFARAADGRLLTSYRDNDQWQVRTLENKSQAQEVERLIQNLKAKKKSGLYQLPLPTTEKL